MQGMSRETGSYLSDLDHLKQSIIDILTTPIGSRVICRDYGSNLFALIDKPINRDLFPQIYSAVADALDKWESRFKVQKIIIESVIEGHITLSLIGFYTITQQKITLTGVTI